MCREPFARWFAPGVWLFVQQPQVPLQRQASDIVPGEVLPHIVLILLDLTGR